jgi:hypothetical protein
LETTLIQQFGIYFPDDELQQALTFIEKEIIKSEFDAISYACDQMLLDTEDGTWGRLHKPFAELTNRYILGKKLEILCDKPLKKNKE